MIHNNNPLPDWWARVDQIMAAAGVPTRVWTAIAYPESSFVPWAANTNDPHGGSYGLFALNLGGQGHGFPVPYLKDPINNAMIASKYIGPAVKKCGADNIECIALNSGHPIETGTAMPGNALVANIRRYYAAGAGKSSQEIYDTFTSGQGIPADPGGGGGLTDIPGQIGSGLVSAVGSAFSSFFSAWADATIETRGPTTMAVVGVLMIATGSIIAAMKTDAGQTVVKAGGEVAGAAAAGAL